MNENERDLPIMVYDVHKLAAEKYLQYYAGEFAILAVPLRLSKVYGPGTNVGSVDRGVLNRMIMNAVSDEPLTVYLHMVPTKFLVPGFGPSHSPTLLHGTSRLGAKGYDKEGITDLAWLGKPHPFHGPFVGSGE